MVMEPRIDIDHARRGAKALLDAARAGRVQEVAELLESGAPPNARDPQSGGTALHLAAAAGRLDVVDRLVSWAPVDKQARDAAGRTALAACLQGSADPVVAKVLVSVGLEPEAWMAQGVPGELAAWLREREGRRRDRAAMPERFAEAAWRADVALLRLIARSPRAEVRVVGDGFAVASGRFDNTRNGVVCSRLPEPAADDEIALALAWLRARRVPGQWLLGPVTEPPDLRARLERAGCRPERSAVHTAAALADLDLSPGRAPADLEIVAIHDAESLAEALDDPDDARWLASLGLNDTAPLRHYGALGAGSGRAAGMASLLIDGPVACVLELAVEASRRRRGIGRALVRHALREAADAGCTTATIAPTPATVPFYEALGLVLERYPDERTYYTPSPP
jgi:GNAT superfamily N-acetyltransferase